MQKLRVGILIFENVEVLDFAGPFEIFSRTRLEPGPDSRRTDETAPFEVGLVAPTPGVVDQHAACPVELGRGAEVVARLRRDQLRVPGRLREGAGGMFTIKYGYGDTTVAKRSFTIGSGREATGGIVSRLWAQANLHALEADANPSQSKIIAHCNTGFVRYM